MHWEPYKLVSESSNRPQPASGPEPPSNHGIQQPRSEPSPTGIPPQHRTVVESTLELGYAAPSQPAGTVPDSGGLDHFLPFPAHEPSDTDTLGLFHPGALALPAFEGPGPADLVVPAGVTPSLDDAGLVLGSGDLVPDFRTAALKEPSAPATHLLELQGPEISSSGPIGSASKCEEGSDARRMVDELLLVSPQLSALNVPAHTRRVVTLNVGGQHFVTTLQTLMPPIQPQCFFHGLARALLQDRGAPSMGEGVSADVGASGSGGARTSDEGPEAVDLPAVPLERDADGHIFLDRDPTLFPAIMRYLRTLDPIYSLSRIVPLALLIREARYFHLEALASAWHSELVHQQEAAVCERARRCQLQVGPPPTQLLTTEIGFYASPSDRDALAFERDGRADPCVRWERTGPHARDTVACFPDTNSCGLGRSVRPTVRALVPGPRAARALLA